MTEAAKILAVNVKEAIPKGSKVVIISSDLYTRDNPRPSGKASREGMEEAAQSAIKKIMSQIEGITDWRNVHLLAPIYLRASSRSRALAAQEMVMILNKEKEQ